MVNEKINFAWPVTSENAVVLQYFHSKTQEIKALLRDKRIVIFGSGIRGCCLLAILQKQGYSHFVFCDNNPEKQGHLINTSNIISLETALSYKEKQVFLVSPEDSSGINEQLINAGLRENEHWFSLSCSAYNSYVIEYLRPIEGHLLVMGDCAFTHVALYDDINESLGVMIRDQVGTERCKVLDMHGMGQQAYYHIARSLLDRGEHPKAFLLLLMIETMAAKVPIMPRTQHPELIKSLVSISKNPRQEFCDYAELARERFNRFQVESFTSFDGNLSQENEKLYMMTNYLFKFRENSEGVVYLKETIKMMNDEGASVILYIPPVNYFQGELLFGEGFKVHYETNFKKLYAVLDMYGLKYDVADASYLLSLNDFAAQNTIDETCNYNGRVKLLRFLSEFVPLKQWFNHEV